VRGCVCVDVGVCVCVWGGKINQRQDRQCAYNVTWRRFYANTVAVEKQ
jgi:hypothetical protein